MAVGTRTDGTGVAYRWELPAPARSGPLGWHQFHKDSRRTGSWADTDLPPRPIPPRVLAAAVKAGASSAAAAKARADWKHRAGVLSAQFAARCKTPPQKRSKPCQSLVKALMTARKRAA